MGSEPVLTPEDRELLERLARRVVELRMDVPALLTLETARPLSVVASQTMVFFEPLVQSLFSFPHYRRFAALVERRDAIEHLMKAIETEADRVDQERRARRAAAKAAPPGPSSSR